MKDNSGVSLMPKQRSPNTQQTPSSHTRKCTPFYYAANDPISSSFKHLLTGVQHDIMLSFIILAILSYLRVFEDSRVRLDPQRLNAASDCL